MNIKPVKVLLADDDLDDCLFFKEALSEMPVSSDLTIMGDGEQLMEYLLNETTPPDILFLDLNMPRKNGFECLVEIKLNPKLAQLPVVIFSTSLEDDSLKRLFYNGAQYFIRKPPEFSKYKEIIRQLVTLVSEQELQEPTIENFVFTPIKGLIV